MLHAIQLCIKKYLAILLVVVISCRVHISCFECRLFSNFVCSHSLKNCVETTVTHAPYPLHTRPSHSLAVVRHAEAQPVPHAAFQRQRVAVCEPHAARVARRLLACTARRHAVSRAPCDRFVLFNRCAYFRSNELETFYMLMCFNFRAMSTSSSLDVNLACAHAPVGPQYLSSLNTPTLKRCSTIETDTIDSRCHNVSP